MIDAPEMLIALAATVGDARFGDPRDLAKALGFDLATASMTANANGTFAIYGARRIGDAHRVGILGGTWPRKSVHLIVSEHALPFDTAKLETLGTDFKRIRSAASDAVGVEFWIGGLRCGATASRSGERIESLFCEEPEPPAA